MRVLVTGATGMLGSHIAEQLRARGQRVRKRHPDGGLIGLGTSPLSSTRLCWRWGSGMGDALSKAWV